MDRLIALVASGLSVGAIYTLVSLGFLLIYKASGMINFSQGALLTLGAYFAAWGIIDLGLPVLAAYGLSLALMFLVGVFLERVAFAPLRGRPILIVLISTLAAALAIEALIVLWKGPLPRRLETPVGSDFLTIGGAVVGHQRIMIVAVTGVAVVALSLLFRYTQFGRTVRALAADPETARLQGIRASRLSLITWGVSGMLAGLAGILMAPLSSVNPGLGFVPMLFAFGAAIIGGFGRLGGVVVGGLALGLIETLGAGYISPGFREVYPFLALLLVIALRPEGFFGEEAKLRV